MKNRNKILKIALAKSKHFNGRVWCGCFTQCEIIALVEDGARPEQYENWKFMENCIKNNIKNGISYQSWFYFQKEGLIYHD